MAITRRSFVGGATALAIASTTVSVGGCVAAAPVAAPTVGAWLSELATALSVAVAIDVLKYGAKIGVKEWKETLYDRLGPGEGWYKVNGYCRTEVAPALLVATAATEERLDDPKTTDVVVVLKKGREGVRLPSWAWFALSTFGNKYLDEGDKDLRHERVALLGYALAPAGVREKRVTLPGKLIAGVNYATAAGGYVELGKLENEDHSYTGAIKISGMPDKTGAARVEHFALPSDY